VNQLAHWWTIDRRGESTIGKTLEFWFSGFCAAVMEVTAHKPDKVVRWHVTGGGAPDWADTEVEFQILRNYDLTFLHLRRSNS
jgi:hypothetical protein